MENLVTVEIIENFGKRQVCKAEGYNTHDTDSVIVDWSKDLDDRIRVIYKVKDPLTKRINNEYLYILNYVFDENEWSLSRAFPDIYYSKNTSEIDGVELISKGIL